MMVLICHPLQEIIDLIIVFYLKQNVVIEILNFIMDLHNYTIILVFNQLHTKILKIVVNK
jgi:hypothetical protein